MLAMGRVDGALAHCTPATSRIFAAQMLRHTLVSALRQEGHLFTAQRFHAWFAGLATLAEIPPRHARLPRALCEAILTELAHSNWAPLANLAARMKPALLAPQDLDDPEAHEQAHATIADARNLIERHGLPPSPLAFSSLSQLYREIGENVRFAPTQRLPSPLQMQGRFVTFERAPLPSPYWAIELLYGQCLRLAGILSDALPCPGLIRPHTFAVQEPETARTIRANGLLDVARDWGEKLNNAADASRMMERPMPGRRGTSRAPALFELLAGFGPMRSIQIEGLLGATRLGVRGMLTTLDEMGVLDRTTISGSHLYSVSSIHSPALCLPAAEAGSAFSTEALGDFEASLARIDSLLDRGSTDAESD